MSSIVKDIILDLHLDFLMNSNLVSMLPIAVFLSHKRHQDVRSQNVCLKSGFDLFVNLMGGGGKSKARRELEINCRERKCYFYKTNTASKGSWMQ